MSYRGENSVAQSVQVWDGTSWVALEGLLFEDVFSEVPSTIWKGPDGELGFSNGTGNNLFGQSPDVQNLSAVATTARVVTKKIRVFLQAAAFSSVSFTLPITIYAQDPEETGSIATRNRLLVDANVAVNREDGSNWQFGKWLLAWRWESDAAGYSDVVEVAEATPTGTTVVEGDATGTPAAPVITFSQGGDGGLALYMVEMDISLIILEDA